MHLITVMGEQSKERGKLLLTTEIIDHLYCSITDQHAMYIIFMYTLKILYKMENTLDLTPGSSNIAP